MTHLFDSGMLEYERIEELKDITSQRHELETHDLDQCYFFLFLKAWESSRKLQIG